MALSPFELERRRLDAASRLPIECFDDFLRLSRSLLHGPAFQWLLVDAPQDALRKQVMQALDGLLSAAGWQINRFYTVRVADVGKLEARLVKNAAQAEVVHVLVSQGWFTPERWDAFNVRRERLAKHARARLVFWLDEAAIQAASQAAPDLWAWRGGVYTLKLRAPTVGMPLPLNNEAPLERKPPLASTTSAQRHRRVGEIEAWLKHHANAPDELLTAPLEELGDLLVSLGRLDEALVHWRLRVLPVVKRQAHAHQVAIVHGRIADVLHLRGELDEVLRIHRQEELPVFQQLGDQRGCAIVLAKIAEVMLIRGEWDEALHICRNDVLPVLEQLGDLHSSAATLSNVADILQKKGEWSEALGILRERVLPAFERLGEQWSVALAMSRIALILQKMGKLDEALRTLREKVLPVFERLGDARERALTMGQIANILQEQGEWSEALRIRREEEMPVYEELGDQRALLVARTNFAMMLLTRGKFTDREEARQLLSMAHDTALKLQLPEAQTIAKLQHDVFELGKTPMHTAH